MMKDRIAIPDKDLKTWRSRGGKRKPAAGRTNNHRRRPQPASDQAGGRTRL